MNFPKELEHLIAYKEYARELKPNVWGFFIPQFKEDGSKNPLWYEFRVNTLGASETATSLKNDYDEYGIRAKLWWSKLGRKFKEIKSKFTFWGLELEENTAVAWQYYDGTDEGYIDNRYEGKKIRTYEKLNCYAVNIKYPFLSASFDFLVPAGQANPFTGEIMEFSFPLEVKQISAFAAEKYELGLPVRYIFQVHQQALIWEVDYAEIAYLKAGTDFNVLPIFMNEAVTNQIIEETKEFWDLVQQGKGLYADFELESNEAKREELSAQLDTLEPPPEGNKGYEEFWKEKYKNTNTKSRPGTEEEWGIGTDYNALNKKIKDLEKEKQLLKNQLLRSIQDYEEVTFNDSGRIVHRFNEGSRTYFGVNLKLCIS